MHFVDRNPPYFLKRTKRWIFFRMVIFYFTVPEGKTVAAMQLQVKYRKKILPVFCAHICK